MSINPNISVPAALIGEPTRAAILMALCDGRSQAAGALANALNISPQSASNHLSLLVEGGLLAVVQQGRHRYYRLASEAVAQSIESLALIAAPIRTEFLKTKLAPSHLYSARCCYSHLAGKLGVMLLSALLEKNYLSANGVTNTGRVVYALTESGHHWLEKSGFKPVAAKPVDQTSFAFSCVDWTERRNHLAGTLGITVLSEFIQLGIFRRGPEARSLLLTPKGSEYFYKEFDIGLDDLTLRRFSA
jgi:DNA-binding transcriptional ArsR family regulator